ncbi:MAG: ribonuclease E/G [Lachnospiraceae bacterium]|nr:ribonuclease E/G [Lachnospiraceae bacterium]
MSESKYLFIRRDEKILSFLMQGQKAIEIHCDDSSADSLLGNIYIGKIKNIAKNIGAAFVEIAPGQVCYLPLEDMKAPVYTKKGSSRQPQAGDELLVQVSRDAIKTKAPAVTTKLTLHGKYVLLTVGDARRSVSSKLGSKKREQLLELLERIPESKNAEYPEYGWLLRTNAGDAEETLLAKDICRLRNQFEALMQQARYRTCFSCLIRTPSVYLTRLSNLYQSDAEQILTDDEGLYREISEYLTLNQPEDLPRLSLYRNELLPVHKLYSLEHQLAQALQEKVWLNSGGYLVIQPTEALTVIDVNTGKYEGGKKKEAAFLKINQEAAVEIARQIRLRNLSGIIIVDFINMESEESITTLLSVLRERLQRDPIPTVLVDMTKLSLVEITRKKVEKPLSECCRM